MRHATAIAILILASAAAPQDRGRDAQLKACFEEAMKAASVIKSDYLQSDVMSEIAEVQGRAGWAKDALETIEAMTYDYHKSLAYAYAARELGKVGKVKEAREILERGMTSTDDGDKDFKTGNAYGHIATVFAQIGDFDRAIKIASPGAGGWGPDSFAMRNIATLLAQSGDIARAIKMVPEDEYRPPPWVLFEAARDLLKEGKTRNVPEIIAGIDDANLRSSARLEYAKTLAAKSMWDDAARVAEAITDDDDRIEAFADLGIARAKAGQPLDEARLRTAEGLLGRLTTPYDKVEARLQLARWKAAVRDPAGASKLAEAARVFTAEITDWPEGARIRVACTFAEIGAHDRALELAGQLPENSQGTAFQNIASALYQQGDRKRFEEVLGRVTSPFQVAMACFKAAQVEIQRGAKDEARRLLRRSFEDLDKIDVGFTSLNDVRNGTDEWSLLHDLLEAQAKVGDFEGARATGLKGEKDQRGGQYGGAIARRLARFETKAERLEEALVWIRKLKDPMSRTLAYVGAAEGLIDR